MKFPRWALPAFFLGIAVSVLGATGEATSHYARQGTNRVHYLALGPADAPVVTLIHGWGGSTEIWREQIPVLTNHARLLVIDLPGHGASDKPKVDYTLDYFGSAVLAVLRDAGVKKATLVGHSMGTPVICRVYQQEPEKVAAVVAVDGLLRRPKGDPAQMEQFLAPLRAPEYRQHVTNFIGMLFPNPGTERLRDQTLDQILQTPQFVLSSAMDGMFNQNQKDWDLKKVSIPVISLNAKNAMWTSEYEEYVKSLSSEADYRTIEGVGHFLMVEKPADFNAALNGALKKYHLTR